MPTAQVARPSRGLTLTAAETRNFQDQTDRVHVLGGRTWMAVLPSLTTVRIRSWVLPQPLHALRLRQVKIVRTVMNTPGE